ncbi:MAG: ATPase [Cystobacterineae bacterium]|nr:ATPase [Cystobacterineae bacterium]
MTENHLSNFPNETLSEDSSLSEDTPRPGSYKAMGPIPRRKQGEPVSLAPAPQNHAAPFVPLSPKTCEETGLPAVFLEELVLKALFFSGGMRGAELVQHLRLPSPIVDEVVDSLRREKHVELYGSTNLSLGKSGMQYRLTHFSRDLLKQILERSHYHGPAPIPFEKWATAARLQSVRNRPVSARGLRQSLQHLVLPPNTEQRLGPALSAGRSLFVWGPPGNGKTAICRKLAECLESAIFIPHALWVDNFVIRFFDKSVHVPLPLPLSLSQQGCDGRWVYCQRPFIVAGGELSLEVLDLSYSPYARTYEAPPQLKATNGMLLIDDFGRQRVSPRDLLNRWIVPLENDVDFLTLHTGKKLQVPFDNFVVFSTNLNPTELVDEAFLRRVRYKLEVPPPTLEAFFNIWEKECLLHQLTFSQPLIQQFIQRYYMPIQRPFAACHPRDLIAQIVDIARYRQCKAQLNSELLWAAAENYFSRFPE